MNRFKRLFGLLAGLMIAAGAAADTYPTKTVSILVPYPAGGPADALARIVNIPLEKQLGQQVLVENVGGVGGAIGAQKVLSAPADGYYLFQGSPNEMILAPLVNAAVKVRAEDFRLVQPISNGVLVLVVRKGLSVNNADELIALARSRADKPLSYGSVGIGSLNHLVVEDMRHRTGTQLVHIPYKGSAPAMQDLAGGQIDFAVLVYSASLGGMDEQGRLKVIGQLDATRSELLKNIPTVSEGKLLPNFHYTTWAGFMVPKDTPQAVTQRLNSALGKVLQEPQVRSQLAAQTLMAAQPMSLAEAAKFFQAETARYREIARTIGLEPQ